MAPSHTGIYGLSSFLGGKNDRNSHLICTPLTGKVGGYKLSKIKIKENEKAEE